MKWQHKGLTCLARITTMGIPVGYVGLPKSHPDHGKHYDDIDIDVHGGLTFSGYWEDQNDGLWYIGFDCGHAWDVEDTSVFTTQFQFKSNKPLNFVEEETERLAEQLARHKKK